MGRLIASCGAKDAARLCFNTYLNRYPDDPDGARLLLAALGDGPIPERASDGHIDQLYAYRASNWDEKAKTATGYFGADLVAAVLDRLTGATDGLDIVDAGCGTGLVGSLVAKKARRLVGVDLSSPMIAKAKEKGIYHHLQQGDLVAFLNDHAESCDVVTSAATLIHFGDLRPAFEAVALSLRDRGLFIFTLFPSKNDDDEFAVGSADGLGQGGCFTHGRNYVARMAAETGFMVETLDLGVHEYQNQKPMMGIIAGLRRVRRQPSQASAA
jgi:predicted TPR repeat methyltransferase